jgi:hypothetical protein
MQMFHFLGLWELFLYRKWCRPVSWVCGPPWTGQWLVVGAHRRGAMRPLRGVGDVG